MIAEQLRKIAEELIAGQDPRARARQLIAHIDRVAELERKHEGQTTKARAVVEKLKGAADELVALENDVEMREVLPVDGTPS